MDALDEDKWFEEEQLHFAASDGDVAKVRELIIGNVPLNTFDDIHYTPLHHAAVKGHLGVVKLLIEAGADINACEEKKGGNTVLREIAENCSIEMAALLIEAGADPTIPGWMGITALDKASKRKRGDGPKVYALLLEAFRRFA